MAKIAIRKTPMAFLCVLIIKIFPLVTQFFGNDKCNARKGPRGNTLAATDKRRLFQRPHIPRQKKKIPLSCCALTSMGRLAQTCAAKTANQRYP
jgi:hypothetical protein